MVDVLYYVYLKKRGKNLCIMKNLRFIDSLVTKLLEKKEREIIIKWFDKIGLTYGRSLAYRHNYDGVFTIYSNRIGMLIGLSGRNVKILEDILAEEYHREYKVVFEEITGVVDDEDD